MTLVDINDFSRQMVCTYDEEEYSVRDNGAVMRHHRPAKRVRSGDNQWVFGKIVLSNGYLHISNVRIHRIVATAFHGIPPNPQYVVDHIDTNRCNNRPENLRWVTRLENTLINPVTRRKIELICGSIEAFLENPWLLNAYQDDQNFSWMRTVTPEEAQNCKERMTLWASTDKKPNGGFIGEWVYEPIKKPQKTFGRKSRLEMALANFPDANDMPIGACRNVGNTIEEVRTYSGESELVMALTKMCAQNNWRVPSCFPCCPEEISIDALEEYYRNLSVGAVFSYNDSYPKSVVLEFVKTKDSTAILVMCEKEGMKPWSVAEITFENNLFIHTNLGSYFDKVGADKTFCLKQGLEWTGGEVFDDFC